MAYNSKRNGGEVEHLLDYTSQLETSLPEKFSEIDTKISENKKRITQTEESTESIQEKLPALENAKATTYEKLVTMCHAGQLVRGTDYKFAFKTIYRSGGVNKEADTEYTIIAHAISENKISSDVKIYEHPDWEVKYTMEDSDTRLDWSREDDMGQIYYLKDERGNSAGFDFKNIEMPMYKHLTSLGEVIWLGTTESICGSLYVEEIGWFKLFSDDTKLYNITIEHEFGKLPNSHIEYTGYNRREMLKIGLKNSYLKGDLCSVNAIDSYAYIYDVCDVKHIKRSIIELNDTKADEIWQCEGSLEDSTFSNIKNIYANFSTCEIEEIYYTGVLRQYSFYRAHLGNFRESDSGTWTFDDLKISNTAGKTYSTGKHKTVKFSRNVDFTIEQRYNFAAFKNCTKLFIFGYANSTTDDAYIAAVDGVSKTETEYVFPKGDTPQLVKYTISVDSSESHTIRFGGAQVCAIVGIYSPKGRNYNLHGRIKLLSSAIDSSSYISANSHVQYPPEVYRAVSKDYQRLYRTSTTDEGVFYTGGGNRIVGYSVSALQKKDGAYYISNRDEEYSFYLDYAELWEYLHPCMKEFYSETKGVITHRLVDPYTLIEVCDEKQLSKYDNDAGFITEQDYFSEVEVTDTEAVQTIKPNVFYKFGVRDNLEIIFDHASEKEGIVSEYRFEFETTTDSVITLPSSILWKEEPVFENGTIYQISVLNNVGTVTSAIPPPMDKRYMYFKSSYDGFTFTFTRHIYYLIDGTNTWVYLPPNTASAAIPKNTKVYLKARLEDNYIEGRYGIGQFRGDTWYQAGGNLKSLCLFDSAYGAKFTPPVACFYGLFDSDERLKWSSNLDLSVSRGSRLCFSSMFAYCTWLESGPDLPNVPLDKECCYSMFDSCTTLFYFPLLPSTELGVACYYNMFCNCDSAEGEVVLPAEHVPSQAYEYIFDGASKLDSIVLLCKSLDENAFGEGGEYWLPNSGRGTIYIHPEASWTNEDLKAPSERWTIEKAVLDETNNE